MEVIISLAHPRGYKRIKMISLADNLREVIVLVAYPSEKLAHSIILDIADNDYSVVPPAG